MNKIKSIKIMLPYLNDEYEVGKEIRFCNQASSGDNKAKVEEYGVVKEISETYHECDSGISQFYLVEFENGKKINFENVPMQVNYAESE